MTFGLFDEGCYAVSEFQVFIGNNGVFRLRVFDFTKVDETVGTLNNHIHLHPRSVVAAPRVVLHGNLVESMCMTNLVYMCHVDKTRPSVRNQGVEILFPIVLGGHQ